MEKGKEELCEECEDFPIEYYCPQCDQSICAGCDQKIHNRAKRAQHIRQKLVEQQQQQQQLMPVDPQILIKAEEEVVVVVAVEEPEAVQKTESLPEQTLPQSQQILTNSIILQEGESIQEQKLPEKKTKKKLRLNPQVEEFKINLDDSKLQESQNQSAQNISTSFMSFHLQEEDSQNNSYFNINQTDMVQSLPLCQAYQSHDIWCIRIEDILRSFFDKGELMVSWDIFIEKVNETKKLINEFQSIEQILTNSKDIFHQTMRKFGDSKPSYYVSIRLVTLSVEAIVWVLKSIRRDYMTPTEKLIFSRIKECFAFKLNQLDWNMIMNYLSSLAAPDNNSIVFDNPKIPSLVIRTNKETVSNSTSNAQNNGSNQVRYIYFLDKEWIAHDSGTITDMEVNNWNTFLQFLKDFFSDDKKQLWISSVTNIYSNDPKKSIVKPPKSVNRAIPGGRYGCAQLIKCCGPQQLKNLTLGKLSLYVQEAISKGILIYYKTLLIKGNLDQQNSQPQENMEERENKIQYVRKVIIDILRENPSGVSLARLPRIINKRVNFPFDIQDLGFLKLKNLLKTIEGVWIENDGTTYAYAFFNENNFNIQTFLKEIRVIIKNIVIEHPKGITGDQMYYQVSLKLGYGLDLQAFASANFSDFLKKYADEICQVVFSEDQFRFEVFPRSNNGFQQLFKFDKQHKLDMSDFDYKNNTITNDSDEQSFKFIEDLLNDDDEEFSSGHTLNKMDSSQNDLHFSRDFLSGHKLVNKSQEMSINHHHNLRRDPSPKNLRHLNQSHDKIVERDRHVEDGVPHDTITRFGSGRNLTMQPTSSYLNNNRINNNNNNNNQFNNNNHQQHINDSPPYTHHPLSNTAATNNNNQEFTLHGLVGIQRSQ